MRLPLFVFQLGNLYSLQKTRREVFNVLKSCHTAKQQSDTERGQAQSLRSEHQQGLREINAT